MEKRCVGPEEESGYRPGRGSKVARVAERLGGDVEAKNWQGKEQPLIVLMGLRGALRLPGRLSRFVGRGKPLSS